MKQIAIENNFIDILRMTWSCWYPIDGKPCNKCSMCKHREKI